MTMGASIGIVVGAAVGVILIVVAAVLIIKFRKGKSGSSYYEMK